MSNDEREAIKVYLVNPPGPEVPWRTRGDYEEDQRRSRHQFRMAIVATIVSIVSVVATTAVAIVTILSTS